MVALKYFGTDGVRGRVGSELINPSFALKLGWAAGRILGKTGGKILIGKDPRISGYMFESALEAGLVAGGMNVELLGPIPTPAVAYLTRTLRAEAGIVISASHNKHSDNGIKFFSREGKKLAESIEAEIEAMIDQPMEVVDSTLLGRAYRTEYAEGRYIEFCKSTVPLGLRLTGLKIVLDCANGATFKVAPPVFQELGATVTVLNAKPNGFNINQQCGSTYPGDLQVAVKQHQADIGIAFDGDGDRVIMVDHQGELVDGDELLVIMAAYLKSQQALQGGVVGTVMTNYGCEQALKNLGIDFVRSAVGDRHVLAALVKNDWVLGGESSGHLVNLAKTTSGDGIISALQILHIMANSNQSLSQLKRVMTKLPQVLINVEVDRPKWVVQQNDVQTMVANIEEKLGSKGRVLLRASGTEPVVRVMLEGEDLSVIQLLADELVEFVKGIPIAFQDTGVLTK